MSAAANAMRPRARRTISGAPSMGGALAKLQGIMDNLVAAEVNVVSPSVPLSEAVSSSPAKDSGSLSASFTPGSLSASFTPSATAKVTASVSESASAKTSVAVSNVSSPAVSSAAIVSDSVLSAAPSSSPSVAVLGTQKEIISSSDSATPKATSSISSSSSAHATSAASSASHAASTEAPATDVKSSTPIASTASSTPAAVTTSTPAPETTPSSSAKATNSASSSKASSAATTSPDPATQRAETTSSASSAQASSPASSSTQTQAAQTTVQASGGSVGSATTQASGRPAGSTSTQASGGPGGSAAVSSSTTDAGSPPSSISKGSLAPPASDASSATTSGNGFVASSPTQHAASTFSTPVAVTVSESHSTFVTTPAFVTSVSVQTGTNGLPDQTFTSVIANPTKAVSTDAISGWSFWDDKSHVAGVVIAILVAICAAILGAFCCRRRRLRRRAGAQRLSGEWSRQQMLEQPTTYGAVRNLHATRDDPERHLMAPSVRSGESVGHSDATALRRTNSLHSSEAHSSTQYVGRSALGLSGFVPDMPKYEGPFGDYNRYPSSAGDTRMRDSQPEKLAAVPQTHDNRVNSGASPAKEDEGRSSPAPSTPSIYPPSLPAVPEKAEDDYLFYQRETRPRPLPVLPIAPPKAHINDADSANPFSDPTEVETARSTALQRMQPLPRVETGRPWCPPTPPDSSCGGSTVSTPVTVESAKPADPFQNAFLGRRVSTKFERPARNPLRLSSTSVVMNKWDDVTKDGL